MQHWDTVRALPFALVTFLTEACISLPGIGVGTLSTRDFAQPYVVNGIAQFISGIIITVVAPQVGARADAKGSHKFWLVVGILSMCIPYAGIKLCVLAAGGYSVNGLWIFTGLTAVTMWDGLVTALVAAMVPACFQGNQQGMAKAYNFVAWGYSTGLVAGTLAGQESSFDETGTQGLLASGGNLLVALLFIPATKYVMSSSGACNGPDEYLTSEVAPEEPSAATEHGVCELLRRHPTLLALSAVIFLDWLAESMYLACLILYCLKSLHYTREQLGVQTVILGLMISIGLFVVVPQLTKIFGNLRVLQAGCILKTFSFAASAFAQTWWQFALVQMPVVIYIGIMPTSAMLTVKAVPQAQMGAAQGILGAARTCAGLFSPMIFGFLFQAAATSSLPGWPFLVAAVCNLLAFVVTLFANLNGPAAREAT